MGATPLQRLEAESIEVLRDATARAERPVMLFSMGKDSLALLHLARKAFWPGRLPMPLLHVDTTWKFREMYETREQIAGSEGIELLVHRNPEAKAAGINPFDHGSAAHTHAWKTEGLKQALDQHQFDVAFGGARRDEEASRAKERVCSVRGAQHRWDPSQQRPELWETYNLRLGPAESIRCFPLSNWTELDVWLYILHEGIEVPDLYLARPRPTVWRDELLLVVDDERFRLLPGETPTTRMVRFRTLGCYPLSGATESGADTLPKLIDEVRRAGTTEREGRVIDRDSHGSMERKKQEGYF